MEQQGLTSSSPSSCISPSSPASPITMARPKIESSSSSSKSKSKSSSTMIERGRSESFGKKKKVMLEGYVNEDLGRSKSLSDEDLDELKGCLDLGFGFSYDEIPELCNTLPALELCYSISHNTNKSPEDEPSSPSPDSLSNSIANWKISSPGDHPEDVKARLKFWAQAVACTVKLCS